MTIVHRFAAMQHQYISITVSHYFLVVVSSKSVVCEMSMLTKAIAVESFFLCSSLSVFQSSYVPIFVSNK